METTSPDLKFYNFKVNDNAYRIMVHARDTLIAMHVLADMVIKQYRPSVKKIILEVEWEVE